MTDSTISASYAGESAQSAAPRLSPSMILLIEIALAMGGFGIGTGEFVIMGLLPDVAATYGVSIRRYR